MRVFFFLSQMFLCVEWCCFASVFLAFFFCFLFVCLLSSSLFLCFCFVAHEKNRDSLWFFSFLTTHFLCTRLNRWFSLESIYAHITRYVAFETEVVSHDIGTICARILEQKKDIWVSSRILHWMFFIVWRWDVHICAWWSWCISSENFFFGFSLFFLSVSHHFFFVLLFFFFFFFIPKETKSACVSTTTHQRTHKRKNNTNERKSIDQIIIKNQKCKARDTRTCSSANARAGKTWGNRTWPQFKRWRTSWRAV